jgi:hypothetical protein
LVNFRVRPVLAGVCVCVGVLLRLTRWMDRIDSG